MITHSLQPEPIFGPCCLNFSFCFFSIALLFLCCVPVSFSFLYLF